MDEHTDRIEQRRGTPAGVPCPRCLGGQMFPDPAPRVAEQVCLQCGYRVEIARANAA